MCVATSECPAEAACVAGRCQLDKPDVKPALETASRWVVRPVDIAFVRKGDNADPSLPPAFVLGKEGGVLLLRFSVTLPKHVNIVEAYVVLHRAEEIDADPEAVILRTTRIVEPWVSRSVSWGRLPRLEDTRAPATRFEPNGSSIVRLDVRDLVRGWSRRDPTDQGVAVIADSASSTRVAFASRVSGTSSPNVEPYLELYIQ